MNAGALAPVATCKQFLQVRQNAAGPRAAPPVHLGSVVKNSLTTALGAACRCSGTIKFGSMVAQLLVLAWRAVNAEYLWELEALEERLKEDGDK